MKRRRRVLRFILGLGLLLFLLCLVGAALLYRSLTAELPNIATLKDYQPRVVSQVYDEDGEVIGEFFIEKREVVPLERVPLVLQNALIAAEDANFYHHEGLDFYGILRALLKNVLAGEIVQGGSTITQQVVKSLLLTPERSFKRKVREAILAYRLEKSLSKDEILYLYLNQIYFGHGAYGVQIACKNYFGHDVTEVDLAEAALLAGLPQAPSRYSPARNPELARERQIYVLQRMVGEGSITAAQKTEALRKPISVLPLWDVNLQTAPYFIAHVREHLLKRYGKEQTFCGGLQVYTTLRKEDQEAAREAIVFGVEEYGKRHPNASEASKDPEDSEGPEDADNEAVSDNPLQGALISLDLPEGYLRAMVGGMDYRRSQFNRAMKARRQPGSAIKPIIYAAALDKGYTPSTIVVDSPIVFQDPVLEEKWKPKNYSRRFVGPTTLRDALTHSRNVVTIKILNDIGVNYAMRYAQLLGIMSPLSPDLSLALGSSEVTLLELITAYATFACEGKQPVPLLIHKIVDGQGKVLEEYEPGLEEVLTPQTAYLMNNLLQSVVQEGTGRAVRSLGVPCAGKTGTTNDLRDAWFIGYTTEKVVGVWIGYDRPQNLGKRESGGRAAAPIWLYYMKKILKEGDARPFVVPSGIVFVKVDSRTGLLADERSERTRLECFKEGTEPSETAEKEEEEMDFFKEDFGPFLSPGSSSEDGDVVEPEQNGPLSGTSET